MATDEVVANSSRISLGSVTSMLTHDVVVDSESDANLTTEDETLLEQYHFLFSDFGYEVAKAAIVGG